MSQKRLQFTTKLGVIATTVGSAVGLGNIWRFPYEAGEGGGGAFIVVYLLVIALIGIPVICAEFVLGRSSRRNIFGAFRHFSPKGKWHYVGYVGILASIMILSFYSVVAGWTMEYIYQSVSGGLDYGTAASFQGQFDEFSHGNWRPLMWTVAFLLCNLLILRRGVQKGVEKMSNIMMPILFVLLVAFCVNSLMMDKADEGLQFLFNPDFSKVTPQVVIGAMGQAFFSLSIGLGTMMTYASYFSKKTDLRRSAAITAVLDTFVAILAAVIIFPAVFSFGESPAQGPALVFEILPAIFSQLPGSAVWSVLFFVLLFIASLTSTISMSEVSIAFLTDEKKMSREKATWLNTGIAIFFGALCALSFGCLGDVKIFGLTIFGLFDYVTSNILLPVGGFFISLYAGWVLDKRIFNRELADGRRSFFAWLMRFCLRWVAPAAILIIFLSQIGVL